MLSVTQSYKGVTPYKGDKFFIFSHVGLMCLYVLQVTWQLVKRRIKHANRSALI